MNASASVMGKLNELKRRMEEKETAGNGQLKDNYIDGENAIPAAIFENPYGNSTQGRALEYLGKGMKPSAVATILNVTPGLVSQFLNDPTFKSLVEDRLAIHALAVQKRNERLNTLEDMAIKKVEETLQWIHKPMEAIAALKAINSLERRNPAATNDSESSSAKVVLLQLPTFMMNSIVQVQVSTDSQIVEVDGREMRTMQTGQVMELLRKSQEAKQKGEKEILEKDVVSVQEAILETDGVPNEQYPAKLFL